VARRRATLFSSAFMLTSLATWFMADLLWSADGINGLEWALLTLFVILFLTSRSAL
jgi:membrane glycosyltransferase